MKGLTILWYTLLRLALFALPLVILLVLRINFVVAVIVAAIVGLCLSYLLLAKPRHEMSADLYARIHRRTPVTGEEEDYEDAVVDSAAATGSGAERTTEEPAETEGTTAAEGTTNGKGTTEAEDTTEADDVTEPGGPDTGNATDADRAAGTDGSTATA